MKELFEIQSKIKVAKDLRNDFGKFNYRSTETILAVLKPILAEVNCTLNMSEDIVLIGDRYYIKSTVTLINEAGEAATSISFAREEENKKGMDASQVTGAATSYARKYALGGLLAIDDGKDADSLNTSAAYTERPKKKAVVDDSDRDILQFYASPAIEQAETINELMRVYNDYKTLQSNSDFLNALGKRRQEIEQKNQ